MVADSVDLLRRQRRAFTDPIRMRIRSALAGGPKTAKSLGGELGVVPNRLYYHLRILEAAELIDVAGTQATGRMVEKIYKNRGGNFGSELPGDDPAEVAAFYGALLDLTKEELQDLAFRRAEFAVDDPNRPLALVFRSGFSADRTTAEAVQNALVRQLKDRTTGEHHAPAPVDGESGFPNANGAEMKAYCVTIAVYELPAGVDDAPKQPVTE